MYVRTAALMPLRLNEGTCLPETDKALMPLAVLLRIERVQFLDDPSVPLDIYDHLSDVCPSNLPFSFFFNTEIDSHMKRSRPLPSSMHLRCKRMSGERPL